MKLKKFITVVAMTAMVGTLAVGCGKSDSKDNGSDKKSESSWDSSTISQSYPEKMAQEREEHSLNCSALKKRKTVRKWI